MCYGVQERYIMVIRECHVLEIRITVIVYDHSSLLSLLDLKQQRERSETFSLDVFRPFSLLLRPGLNGDSIEP